MIDLKDMQLAPEKYRASQRARLEDPELIDHLIVADIEYRALRTELEAENRAMNAVVEEIRQAVSEKDFDSVQKLKPKADKYKQNCTKYKKNTEASFEKLNKIWAKVPNLVHPDVPAGHESSFTVVEYRGEPREAWQMPGVYDVNMAKKTIEDHQQIGRRLDIIDLPRGAKVSGSRFYYLKGMGARLENALMSLAQDIAFKEGFTQLVVPNLVSEATMFGTGFLDNHADEIYHLEEDNLYLTGTSEVGLAGYHADEIVDLSNGPLRYTATSTCYRREAGAYGSDTKGIFRVHQFQKTEMFVVCKMEEAENELQNLLRVEEKMLDMLEVPYRVINVPAGDLGSSASRKYDCEMWMASQKRFREVTSTSNCTDFQSRRLKIREKTDRGNVPVATLNGTLITSTRPIIALLEFYQQANGSVTIPSALQPYLGTDLILPKS